MPEPGPQDLLDGPRLVVPTGPTGVVRLEGPDARRFANGMFTNNVRDLPVHAVNRHAMVDDRGRVGGFLDLVCLADDRFLAVLDGVTASEFCTRYETYVVFDDVELVDETEHVRSWYVLGRGAIEAATAAGLAVAEVAEPSPWPRAHVQGDPASVAYRTWGWPEPAVRGISWDDGLPPPEVSAGTPAHLEWARIFDGVPAFPTDTGPKGLPHELGLRDRLLHFEKGCYLGQESINRIDVMGKVRKQLRALRWTPGAGLPEPGAELTYQGSTVGRITSRVQVGDDVIGLAVLKEPAHEPGTEVSVEIAGGSQVARVYALPLSPEVVAGS